MGYQESTTAQRDYQAVNILRRFIGTTRQQELSFCSFAKSTIDARGAEIRRRKYEGEVVVNGSNLNIWYIMEQILEERK